MINAIDAPKIAKLLRLMKLLTGNVSLPIGTEFKF